MMMMKQSNMKFDLELTTNLKKNQNSTRTRNQSMENNYVCQRFAARHGLIVTTRKSSQLTNETKLITSSNHPTKLTHQIQETNINTTIIDVLEKSSSDCPLTETSLKERVNKHLKKENKTLLTSETKQNLNKLQKITDDVKLLTKQLHLSIELNKNNNSSCSTLGKQTPSSSSSLSSFLFQDERFLGEICYQLERRILVLIFSKSKQFYGYSLRYLSLIIQNEENKHQRLIYKKRFLQIENYLLKTNFHFNSHSIVTFNFLNQYGIYPDHQWLTIYSNILTNLNQIKSSCYSMLEKKFHQDFSIIIDTLELISNFDDKPLFYW